MVIIWNTVGKTMSCLPSMTGNGFYIPPSYGEIGDGLLLFYHHYCTWNADFLGVSFAMTTFYLFHDSVDTVCVPAPGSAMLRQLCGHWTPVAPSGCVQVTKGFKKPEVF